MKKIFAFVAVFAFLTLPLVSFAWAPGDPIVPEALRGENFVPQDARACDLVDLFDNLVAFAVFFSTIVATVMFAYAGILYVTASARAENLNQAKNIFGKVFLGFVFILSAWLIINIIMTVLADEKTAPWNDVDCPPARALTSQQVQTGRGQVEVALMNNDLEEANRRRLALLGVQINNEACPAGQTSGCTNVGALSGEAVSYAGDVKEACGQSCEVTITGGSEGGHAGDSNPGTHGGGDKFDLRTSPNLTQWVDDQAEGGRFERVSDEDRTFGAEQWVDTETGAVWTREENPPHFDVCVENCTNPNAKGT